MRYLPHLIPKESKVLPNYFKGSIYRSPKKAGLAGVFAWIFGVFFLLGAFAELPHPPLAFFYGLLGILLIPPGHHWIEKTWRFRFRTRAKTIFGVLVFLCAAPLIVYYGDIDNKARAQAQLAVAREQQEKADSTAREQLRNDSLIFYTQAADGLRDDHKLAEAAGKLRQAASFARLQGDRDFLAKHENSIAAVRVRDMVDSGQYEAATPELTRLLTQTPDADLYYYRAICYSHTRQIEDAVKDCKSATQLGSRQAEELNDKINPVIKHVTGYMTQCCDGSFSDARGRGACSHHGGVCSWNAPIYEESRKYE